MTRRRPGESSDRLAAWNAAIEVFEPTVGWGEVQGILETYRGDIRGVGSTVSEGA